MKLLLNTTLLLIILVVPGFNGQAVAAQHSQELEQAVQYLINTVAASERTFIRNRKQYNGPAAAEHMLKKYAHFKDRIHSAVGFIDLAASKSLMSGKPYLVVSENGTVIQTGAWLRDVLTEYCDNILAETVSDRYDARQAACAR